MAWTESFSTGRIIQGINDVDEGFGGPSDSFASLDSVTLTTEGNVRTYEVHPGMRLVIRGTVFPDPNFNTVIKMYGEVSSTNQLIGPINGVTSSDTTRAYTNPASAAQAHLVHVGEVTGNTTPTGGSNPFTQGYYNIISNTGCVVLDYIAPTLQSGSTDVLTSREYFSRTNIIFEIQGIAQISNGADTTRTFRQIPLGHLQSAFCVHEGSALFAYGGGGSIKANGSVRLDGIAGNGSNYEQGALRAFNASFAFGGCIFDSNGYPTTETDTMNGTRYAASATNYTPRNSISQVALSNLTTDALCQLEGHNTWEVNTGRHISPTGDLDELEPDRGNTYNPAPFNLYAQYTYTGQTEDDSLLIKSNIRVAEANSPGNALQIIKNLDQANNISVSQTLTGPQANATITRGTQRNIYKQRGLNILGSIVDVNPRGTGEGNDDFIQCQYDPQFVDRSTFWLQEGLTDTNARGQGLRYFTVNPLFLNTSGTPLINVDVLIYDSFTSATHNSAYDGGVNRFRRTRTTTGTTFLNGSSIANTAWGDYNGENIYEGSTDNSGRILKSSLTENNTTEIDLQSNDTYGVDILSDFGVSGTGGGGTVLGILTSQYKGNRGNIFGYYRKYGYVPQSFTRTAPTFDSSITGGHSSYYEGITGNISIFDDAVLQSGGVFNSGLDPTTIVGFRNATLPQIRLDQAYGLIHELHSRFSSIFTPSVDSAGYIDCDFSQIKLSNVSTTSTLAYNNVSNEVEFQVFDFLPDPQGIVIGFATTDAAGFDLSQTGVNLATTAFKSTTFTNLQLSITNTDVKIPAGARLEGKFTESSDQSSFTRFLVIDPTANITNLVLEFNSTGNVDIYGVAPSAFTTAPINSGAGEVRFINVKDNIITAPTGNSVGTFLATLKGVDVTSSTTVTVTDGITEFKHISESVGTDTPGDFVVSTWIDGFNFSTATLPEADATAALSLVPIDAISLNFSGFSSDNSALITAILANHTATRTLGTALNITFDKSAIDSSLTAHTAILGNDARLLMRRLLENKTTIEFLLAQSGSDGLTFFTFDSVGFNVSLPDTDIDPKFMVLWDEAEDNDLIINVFVKNDNGISLFSRIVSTDPTMSPIFAPAGFVNVIQNADSIDAFRTLMDIELKRGVLTNIGRPQ